MRAKLFFLLAASAAPALFFACDDGPPRLSSASASASSSSSTTGGHVPDGGLYAYCSLPGSVRFDKNGKSTVPGGPANAPDLSFLTLPPGFCAHYFGNVGNTRQIRVAPNGDLFVASPTQSTTGGGPNGRAAILVMPDDDGDGYADKTVVFLPFLPKTQGIAFIKDYLYYQDGASILRVPYQSGDRAPRAASETVTAITVFESSGHWPKTLDAADDGTIFVSNGSDQGETCETPRPFRGGILKLDGTPGGTQVAKGFRNPIAVRCQRGHNNCFAAELAKDYSAVEGGREKLVPIRQGDDWGYPCCATKDKPYAGETSDCSGVAADTDSWIIADTPFGFDFEPGKWDAPYKGSVIVALHGAFGSWTGERVVAIGVDPATGMPLPATNIHGANEGAMTNFITGWDNTGQAHGRPAEIAFGDDGRLWVANDTNGDIFWVAPFKG